MEYCTKCKKKIFCLGKHMRLFHNAESAGVFVRFQKQEMVAFEQVERNREKKFSNDEVLDMFMFEAMELYNRTCIHWRQQNIPRRFMPYLFITKNESMNPFDPLKAFVPTGFTEDINQILPMTSNEAIFKTKLDNSVWYFFNLESFYKK